jgi:hypothetical protein
MEGVHGRCECNDVSLKEFQDETQFANHENQRSESLGKSKSGKIMLKID